MIITKVILTNFKCFEYFELELFDDVNVIVGDNETGKSTILEAINLALTYQLNGRSIFYELTPYLFNENAIKKYVDALVGGQEPLPAPPEIKIELFLKEDAASADFLGRHNSTKESHAGLTFSISIDETEFADEYLEYIKDPSVLRTIPIEYYKVELLTFAGDPKAPSHIPLNTCLIDVSNAKHDKGPDGFVSTLVKTLLSPKENAELRLKHRQLKERFEAEATVTAINKRLKELTSDISNKAFSYSVDTSNKASWESGLSTYLDDLPFRSIGKGEQTAIKTRLALHKGDDDCARLCLIEEPENHLSFSNMSKLIRKIQELCVGKQLIITTHSSFVLNKLGINKTILINKNQKTASLKDLSSDTQDYFSILPGYDTLRILLSNNPILVEGPSDELIVQKVYLKTNGCLPIEAGIDVISVRGLAFARFLEIAKLLRMPIRVVTDNDGSVDRLNKKYADFRDCAEIGIFFDTDEAYTTLESQIVKANLANLEPLQRVLGVIKNDTLLSEAELITYMTEPGRKTECALKLFRSDEDIRFPEYIHNAIQ